MNRIQMKIRHKGTWIAWEKIAVEFTIKATDSLAWDMARLLLRDDPLIAEVRWNRVDSLQGRYVSCADPDITLVEGR